MKTSEKALSFTFHGSSKKLLKLEKLIANALEAEDMQIHHRGPIENWGQSGGWVEDGGWGQSGGWFEVIENKKLIKVSQPSRFLTNVSRIVYSVYDAFSKAQNRG
jgi:hypothetical protein